MRFAVSTAAAALAAVAVVVEANVLTATTAETLSTKGGGGAKKKIGIQSKQCDDEQQERKIVRGTFEQLIDHDDPSKGTFTQRYAYNAEYYKEGGPIFLVNIGEATAFPGYTGFLTNTTIPGYYAQEFGGAAILVEHRFWGTSYPSDITGYDSETLQQHTLRNAIGDMTYFASNYDCSDFTNSTSCTADTTPWVLVGGSYSGALSAWTSRVEPGVFAAYHASSAVVEAQFDYHEYYHAVEIAIPSTCLAHSTQVISEVDSILSAGSPQEITALKSSFGMSSLSDSDFAIVLSSPFSGWQGSTAPTFQFCTDIEHALSNGTSTSPLDAWADYFVASGICSGQGGSSCASSPGNATGWDTPTIDDTRSWFWMLCNEPFGWWQTGPAENDGTNIISSHFRPDVYQKQCQWMFPEVNGYVPAYYEGKRAEDINAWTGGWTEEYEKVVFVDGEWDPWRAVTTRSDFRPGGSDPAWPETVSNVIPKAGHVPELGNVDPTGDANIWEAVQEGTEQMGVWLDEWTPADTAAAKGRKRGAHRHYF